MDYITPTIHSLDEIPKNPEIGIYWNHLETFPVPLSDIPVWRNDTEGEFGRFTNTEFLAKRMSRTNRLCIFIGESWCYGGKIRDMNFDNTETPDSFARALDTTVGSWVAKLSQSDLYQNAWPGDNNSNMIMKAERAVDKFVNDTEYNEILLCVQFTDVIRESGVYGSLSDDDHAKQMLDRQEQGETWPSPREWLKEYEHGYFKKLRAIKEKYPNYNIKICVWKNFAPWALSSDARTYQWNDIQSVDDCWINYMTAMEGYPVEIKHFNNPASMMHMNLGDCTNMTQEFKDDELTRIERLHYYWDNISNKRSSMSIHYPSPVAHQIWALNIVKQANWYPEEDL